MMLTSQGILVLLFCSHFKTNRGNMLTLASESEASVILKVCDLLDQDFPISQFNNIFFSILLLNMFI